MARRLLSVLVLLALLIPASAGADTILWHTDQDVMISLWTHEGNVYLFRSRDVYVWTQAGEPLGSYPLTFEEEDVGHLHSIVPGDQSVWGYFLTEGGEAWIRELVFDEDMNVSWGARIDYDWQSVLQTQYLSFYSPLVLDGILIYASNGADGLGRLVTYDFAHSRSRVIDTDEDNYEIDTYFIIPYRDGQALVASFEQDGDNRMIFYSFDPGSRTLVHLCEIPVPMSDFHMPVYDPETDYLYFRLGTRLSRITGFDPDTLEDLGDASTVEGFLDARAVMLEGGAVAYGDWYSLLAHGLPKGEKDVSVSVAAGENQLLSDAYFAFLEENPGADASFSKESFDAGEIGKAILTQSTAYDVYLLELDSQDYGALYDRGYLPPLESDALTALVSGMYETVRDAVMKDGELVALPVDDWIDMMSCNLDVLEAMGLTEADVPRTWPEFLALLPRLPALLADTRYTAFPAGTTADDLADGILSAILDAYKLYLENEPSAGMLFDTDILRNLLAAYEAVDFSALAPEERGDEEDAWGQNALFQLDAQATLDAASSIRIGYYMRHRADEDGASPTVLMPLSLAEGMEPMVPLQITVAVVNPYSENREAAVRYLETAAVLLPDMTRAALTPGWTEPIPSEDADARIADQEERIASLESEVAAATGEDKATYQAMLDEANEYLAFQRRFYWAASEEDLAAYRAYAGYVHAWRYFGLDYANRGELDEMIAQYRDGAIDADTLLQNIDKKIIMMLLEGQ